MAADSELRQRAAAKTNGTAKEEASSGSSPSKSKSKPQEQDAAPLFSVLDVFRTLFGILLISTLSSWLVTSGNSYTWGYFDKRPLPWWTSMEGWKRQMTPQMELTMEQLAEYDGSSSDKPIYLAINRTIYDVSSSPGVYGPGGFYAKLAAKDASRSFVTTCFDPVQDLVPYLGGVEEVFVPLWLSKKASQAELDAVDDEAGGVAMSNLMDQIRQKLGRRKTRKLREEIYEDAKGMVRDKIKNWESMFEKKGYPIVGKVIGVDEADESKWKDLTFCEDALKQRPAAAESLMKAVKLSTGKDKIDISQMGGGASFNEAINKKKKKKSSRKERAKERKEKSAAEAASAADSAAAAASQAAADADDEGHTDERAKARVEDMMGAGKWGARNYPSSGDEDGEKRPWEI